MNILGLTVGMAFCILMFLYVRFELQYDRYHKNAENIYRIASKFERGERTFESAVVPSFSKDLEREFPEVITAARVTSYSWRETALISSSKKHFYEKRFFLADPSFVDIFSLIALQGDPRAALESPRGLILTESAADKYFGEKNPLGQTVTVKQINTVAFEVQCVIKDIPEFSHFHFDFLASITATGELYWENYMNDWASHNFYTYILLSEKKAAAGLEEKLPLFLEKYSGSTKGEITLFLQPLTSIHLKSHLSNEIEPNSDTRNITFFSILGLLVLVIACINYVNLATARSADRTKEIGMRKVVGAGKRHLVIQLLGESILQAFIALPLALVLGEIFLPVFSKIVGQKLVFPIGTNLSFTAGLLGAVLLVGLASGLYPAFLISAKNPVDIFKKTTGGNGASRSCFRNLLVLIQSTVSIILIIATIIVFRQMSFVQKEDLGFSKRNIVIVPMKDYESQKKYPALKQAFGSAPQVISVSASEHLPSEMKAKHRIEWQGEPAGEKTQVLWNNVDVGFLKTYGMELVEGRSFSQNFEGGTHGHYLINESAAKAFGWHSSVGKRIQFSNEGLQKASYVPGRVVGVIKDFHMQSLHTKIEPVAMKLSNERLRYIAVRIMPGYPGHTLDFLQETWARICPEMPFEFFFFEENLNGMYQQEEKLGRVIAYSSGLSVFVACLGLFGLVSFSALQRTKEIGVRKVLGASYSSILYLFGRSFLKWVLWANLFAWPAAYFFMNRWLQNFSYRVDIGLFSFVAAALLAFTGSGLIVGMQAVKSARTNPLKALRYE
ncbi:MAG: ABC transporter permease [Candidatus Aminicenantes bacterium]|nr:ABC transporter permease [Candidatus Aminicenantes bacterium]